MGHRQFTSTTRPIHKKQLDAFNSKETTQNLVLSGAQAVYTLNPIWSAVIGDQRDTQNEHQPATRSGPTQTGKPTLWEH